MNRVELKNEAKEIVKNNKWNIWKPILVLMGVSLLFGILLGVLGITETENELAYSVIEALFSMAIIPVSFGITKYILFLVRGKKYNLNMLKDYYQHFTVLLLISVLTGLFVFLWSLLLIVPGIIASISYSMVQYVFVDNEKIKAKDCLNKSQELMFGHKWEYFVLMLSFLGWIILSILTFGILLIWVVPYITVTEALYYEKLIKSNK